MEFIKEQKFLQEKIEKYLNGCFTQNQPQKKLLEAMRYSLLAGGKRIRPMLLLKFCFLAGGDIDKAMPLAAAIEMIHTYSLIHDDLPSMDDDDLRRGKLTCHKAFGECTATLAGDALQAAAFGTLLSAELEPEVLVRTGKVLADASGELGMCGGQELDTANTPNDVERLTLINDLKTGALLRASCVMGVIAAGENAKPGQLEAAELYGKYLARAFQIRDDVLDIISTSEASGKNVGSDAANGKTTFATIYGIGRCSELVEENTKLAKDAVKGKFEDTFFLNELADTLSKRCY